MEKCIKLGNKDITLRVAAGVLVIYKEQFGTEYIDDMEALKEETPESAVTVGSQLLWAMAKAADDTIRPPVQFYEDIGSFDMEQAFTEAAELFAKSCENMEDMGNGKSNERLTSENLVTSALFCKMSYTDLCRLSLSMALNIIGQYCAVKNGEEITHMATQEELDNF